MFREIAGIGHGAMSDMDDEFEFAAHGGTPHLGDPVLLANTALLRNALLALRVEHYPSLALRLLRS